MKRISAVYSYVEMSSWDMVAEENLVKSTELSDSFWFMFERMVWFNSDWKSLQPMQAKVIAMHKEKTDAARAAEDKD